MQFESSSTGFIALLHLFLNNLFQNKSFWHLEIQSFPSLELMAVAQIRKEGLCFFIRVCAVLQTFPTIPNIFSYLSLSWLLPALRRADTRHKVNKNAAVWTWSSKTVFKKILRVSLRITQISICDHRDSCNKIFLIEFYWAHTLCSQAVQVSPSVAPSPLLCFVNEIKAL